MSDYIKREDALKVFDTDSMIKAWHKTEFIPSADVAPVRHGRWVEHYKSDAPPTLRERWLCSWCGNVQTYGETRYCPNCGAKMDEGEDNED